MDDKILKGAYSAEEFADAIELMREQGMPRGVSTGWPELDQYYAIPKGQWTLVTGFSHTGKSTWIDNLLTNIAKAEHWKFLICSPENQPIERHIASLMEVYSGKKFGRPSELYPNTHERAFMTEEEHREAYKFVVDHFYFVDPPDVEFTVEGIMNIANMVRETFDFDGMVIDPYNEVEHKRPAGMSETDYISWALTQFRRFVRQTNIHLWFVAHPVKPTRLSVKFSSNELEDAKRPMYQRCSLFDTAGAAHWKSKADFGIVIHRDMQDTSTPTVIEVQKVRFRENGKLGEVSMYYDYLCNRFVSDYTDLLWNRENLGRRDMI